MIHVIYASDDGYVRHLATSAKSLLDHLADEAVTLHILSNGISPESQRKLSEMVREKGQEIAFYELSDLESILREKAGTSRTGHFHVATMSRLLAGSILPEEIDRVIYLDSDTAVPGNIAELFHYDLQGNVIGMAGEPTIYPEIKEYLGIGAKEPYFNAGVILFDLAKWREQGMEDKCFAFYRQMGEKISFADQDILNAVCRGQVQPLPQRFNFFSNFAWYHYGTLKKMAPWYAHFETAEGYQKARKSPVVVHFAGDERPWIAGNRNYYRHIYEEHLAKTAWAGAPKIEGKRGYMLFYHLVNLTAYICPPLRALISAVYYQQRFAKKQN